MAFTQRQCITALSLLLAVCLPLVMPLQPQEASLVERHEQWMANYGRVYKDSTEKVRRLRIFKDNVQFIESFNAAGNLPYKLSLNEHADQTNEEFRASRNGYKTPHGLISKENIPFQYENVTNVPASMDWREKGAVTAMKDQGKCRSCWAFSAVAATEGIVQITRRKLISLSEQELVDCDTKGENEGCKGGYMEHAFEFMVNNHGITAEAKYPYKGADRTCDRKKKASVLAKITGYEKVPGNNEQALMKAVANQPVSVYIAAGGSAFQFYSSGVFTGCGTDIDLDHGVTVVGYGTTADGTKYWLVKNSWGTGWGEKGYIRIQRGIKAKEGMCGIAMKPTYPTA